MSDLSPIIDAGALDSQMGLKTPTWLDAAAAEAWLEAQRVLVGKRKLKELRKYADDPVGFCKDILGEDFTDEIKQVMLSVRDNPVTVARSANAVGKSFGAARVAIWFLSVFEDSQIYVTAAPPLDNLKRILWGQIGSIVEKKPELLYGFKIRSMRVIRDSTSFMDGVAISTSGTEQEREAKFCADTDELFEMLDGRRVRYGDLIGRKDVPVVSVDEKFGRRIESAEFFDNGVQPVYEIVFEDGSRVVRTGNHPLYCAWDIRADHHTYGGEHGKGRFRPHSQGWVEAEMLEPGYVVLCPDKTDFCDGAESADDDLVKFLGYMIGDGCFRQKNGNGDGNRLQFTQDRNEQLEEYVSILDRLGAKYSVSDNQQYNWVCVSTSDKKLADFVRECGLIDHGSADKFVPSFVFGLKKDQIALFLNRLFSTDGWASMSNKAEIGYASKSKQLVLDVQCLLRRFGIYAKIVSKIVKGGEYWNLYINAGIDVVRFTEQIGIYGKYGAVHKCYEYSKSRLWTKSAWRFEKPGYRWKKIVSVRSVGERPTVGVYVPVNHTYLTHMIEHNSGKHSPHLLFIVDEADAVPPEVYRGIESCMSGGMARLLCMFNPRVQYGPVYEKEFNRQAKVIELSAFTHPNVVTGRDVFPGAVSREMTVRRINEWTREAAPGEKIDESFFEVPEFLVKSTAVSLDGREYPPLPGGFRKIKEPAFSYMVLGRYPPLGTNQLISDVWIQNAVSRWKDYVASHGEIPPAETRPILGLDVAEMGADANALCARYGDFVAKIKTWGYVDADVTATKGLAAYRDLNAEIAFVDATGVGSSVAPSMSRQGRSDPNKVRAVSIKVAGKPFNHIKSDMGEFHILRDQLWWAAREWLRTNPNAMLPPDPMLIEELKTPTYEIPKGDICVMDKSRMRDLLHRSPDRADAFILTFTPIARPTWVNITEKG